MELTDDILTKIEGILKVCGFEKEEDMWVNELYIGYDDLDISNEDLTDITNSSNPRERFQDIILDIDFGQWMDYGHIKRGLIKDLDIKDESLKEEVELWVDNNVRLDIPLEIITRANDLLLNISVKTEEWNRDYTCNNLLENEGGVEEESSLLWLVRQQGYSKEDLLEALFGVATTDNKFLKSIVQEVIDTTTSMNQLIFFVQVNLEEYFELIENKSDIIISKSVDCGLVDFWQGAGGSLEIILEKDVVIPSGLLEVSVDGSKGYSVREIYGVGQDLWKVNMLR